jgi:hypothetical protein
LVAMAELVGGPARPGARTGTLADFLGHDLHVGIGHSSYDSYVCRLLSWSDYGICLDHGGNLEFRPWRLVWFIRKAQG